MKKLLSISFFLLQISVYAQTTSFVSGFQNILLLYNPAVSGSSEGTEIGVIHKTKWADISSSPKLYAISAHAPFRYGRYGAGVNLYNESAGQQNLIYLNANFSYKINFAKGRLSFGLKTGLVQYSNGLDKLIIKDQEESINSIKRISPDLGLGIFYKDKKYSLGISSQYSAGIYSGNNFTGKMYYHLTGSMNQKISKRFISRPAFLLKYTQHFTPLAGISVPVEYNNTMLSGLSYRTNNILSLMLGININKLLQNNSDEITILYYYDYSAGKLNQNLGNSHEIMLLFNPGKNKSIEKLKRQRATVSPAYFN